MPSSSRVAYLAVFAAVAVATAFDGATTHLPALLLRSVVAIGCVALWPTHLASPRLRDVAAPSVALVAVTVGLATARNVGPAVQAATTVVLVVALYLALVTSETDHAPALMGVAAAVGAVHAIWAIGERLAGAYRGSGGFFNPNYLAAFLAPIVVLALDNTLRGLSSGTARRRLLLSASVASISLTGVVASGSRSALVGCIGGMLLAALPALRGRRWVAVAAGIAGVAGLAFIYQRWLGQGDTFAYARLTHIWPRSVALALRSPMGVGLSGYDDAMRVFGIPFDGWVRYPRLASNAHSEPLNAWVELGWVGLAATLLPPIMLATTLWRQRGQPESGPFGRLAHWGVLVALGLPAAVSASLHCPPLAFFAAIWAAHVVGADRTPGRILPIQPRRPTAAVICGAALVTALPAAVSVTAMKRAATLRQQGELGRALAAAEFGETAAPFSLGASMLAESLRFLTGDRRNDSVERLLDLADRYPSSPQPVSRAAWLLEQEAADPAAWAVVARLRQEAVRRDPLSIAERIGFALALLRAGDIPRARAALTAALEVEPHCAVAHAHLALLYDQAGERGRAEQHARAAWRADAARQTQIPHAAQILSLPEELAKMLHDRGLLGQ